MGTLKRGRSGHHWAGPHRFCNSCSFLRLQLQVLRLPACLPAPPPHLILPMSQQNYQQSPQQPPIKSVSLPQRYPQIVNNPYQNVSSVAGSTDTLQSTLPSASPRPSQHQPYSNPQSAQYPPMSAQDHSHIESRNGRHSNKGKEIYTYHAPWPVYAMDWSKAPTEKGGFRLALGSFIEEHDNKVYIPLQYYISGS
jgi:hypothetical protein